MLRYTISRRTCGGVNPPNIIFPARQYRVLALESSCDDSCVALLEKTPSFSPTVIDHYRATLSLAQDGGIIPTAAQSFHNYTIGDLVQKMGETYNFNQHPPDLICVTRGPGMVGSLTASIQLAKGLAIAWDRPLVGVHHMLGHLLTPRLTELVKFPFLSLLCSGGHTMLVLSRDMGHHEVVVDTMDIAVGDSLDKCAREMGFYGNMLAKEMEKYVDENLPLEGIPPPIEIPLGLPMRGPRNARFPDTIQFSFASFLLRVQTAVKQHQRPLDEDCRRYMAFHIQNLVFDHVIDRVNVALKKHGTNEAMCDINDGKFTGVRDIVVSGGVAANKTLAAKLRSKLCFEQALGEKPTLHFPPLNLCTDNAIMIGLAGIETFETLRKMSDMTMLSRPKWPMGDLLEGYVNVPDNVYRRVMEGLGTCI